MCLSSCRFYIAVVLGYSVGFTWLWDQVLYGPGWPWIPYRTNDVFEFPILLLPVPKCWDCSHVLPHLAIYCFQLFFIATTLPHFAKQEKKPKRVKDLLSIIVCKRRTRIWMEAARIQEQGIQFLNCAISLWWSTYQKFCSISTLTSYENLLSPSGCRQMRSYGAHFYPSKKKTTKHPGLWNATLWISAVWYPS